MDSRTSVMATSLVVIIGLIINDHYVIAVVAMFIALCCLEDLR